MRYTHRRYQFPDGTNYPIIESEANVMIRVTKQDCARAKAKSPTECALAKAAQRLGYEKAFIAGTIAYLVIPWDGRDCAFKFSVPPRTRRAIKEFDESGGTKFPPEGFMLRALYHNQTAEHKKIWNDGRPPRSRAWTGKRGGNRPDLRTYRHLTGQVVTLPERLA